MLIIAPCSSTKKVLLTAELSALSIQAKDLQDFSKQWVTTVQKENNRFKASEVYAGTGIAASISAAKTLGAELKFLSAGMSLISCSELIPSYNLTLSNQGPNPFDQVEKSGSLQEWWEALNKAWGYDTPLFKIIRDHKSSIFICLPSNYLTMVESELTQAVTQFPDKVRIITSTHMSLNTTLAKVAIRYDQRLNTASNGPRGANASFTQRAMLNFARIISEHSAENESVIAQQRLVDLFFKDIQFVDKVKRQKISEDHLLAMIQDALAVEKMSSYRLLNSLREKNGIACEQSRFKKAYKAVMLGA